MPSVVNLPLVLVRTSGNRQHVVAASAEAQGCGIRSGMTLAQARAMRADVVAEEHDADRDARALEALARWMMRFTPTVAIPGFEEGERRTSNAERRTPNVKTPAPPTPGALPAARRTKFGFGSTASLFPGASHALPLLPGDVPAIFLDVTGCDRVFGGVDPLARQVIAALRRLRLTARVAVAPTPGAAWALTFDPRTDPGARRKAEDAPLVIAAPDGLPDALAPLPPHALRIDAEAAAMLHHVGVETIDQLVRLPREQLPARFGEQLLLRLDQALGRVPEPLVPLPHRDPVEAKMDFDGPVASLEAIWHVFRHLIADVIDQLARRGCGARRLDVTLLRPYAPPVQKTILLSRPSRDPVNLFNLFRCALETIGEEEGTEARRHGGTKGGKANHARSPSCLRAFVPSCPSSPDDGFWGLHLRVPLLERVSDEQVLLAGRDEHGGRVELDHLIERLTVRLGPEAICRPMLLESYIPECAFTWQARAAPVPEPPRTRRAGHDEPDDKHPPPRARPLRLLARPVEVGVVVSPSHDRDGRPVLFRRDHAVHHLTHAVGPERIAGQWWLGHDKTRDYFDVEDETGRRFWLFRVNENGRWFVHGEYE